jgi:hypothetical protein
MLCARRIIGSFLKRTFCFVNRAGRSSFLKKRTKKLLVLCRALLRQRATASRSFLLLFFKKEALALSSRGTIIAAAHNEALAQKPACWR